MSDDHHDENVKAAEESTFKRLVTGDLPLETETASFILVNVLDFFMTYWLLASGRFRESNPIAEYFLNHWGPVRGMLYFKLALVLFVCLIAQIVATQDLRKAAWVLNFGTIAVACVVLYSFRLYLIH